MFIPSKRYEKHSVELALESEDFAKKKIDNSCQTRHLPTGSV